MQLIVCVTRVAAAGVLALSPLIRLAEAQPMCVDFEPPLVLGTQYGAPAGNTPGQVVFTTGRIPVAVDFFFSGPFGGTFDHAQIVPTAAPIGSGQSIRTNNINLLFDFSRVGFIPRMTTLAFLDLGGIENFSVNGCPTVVDDLAKIPPSICGATITVSSSPVGSGTAGKVELRGPVFTLKIGGQEFWLDDVCIVN